MKEIAEILHEVKTKPQKDTEVKKFLVDYTGNYLNNSSDDVTVGDIVEVLANEFPEFVLALAEENYFRGYKQAVQDCKPLNVGKLIGEAKNESETAPERTA